MHCGLKFEDNGFNGRVTEGGAGSLFQAFLGGTRT